MPPECAELDEYAAESGSRRRSGKFIIEYDDAVDTDPLLPKLFVLLCAESSLLPPLGVKPAPGTIIFNAGPLLLLCAFSDGVRLVPMGVAKLSFGGPCLPGMAKAKGGNLEDGCGICGGAGLSTGLWLGEAGIASPSLGSFWPDCARPPGTGGRRSGTEDAMFAPLGGSSGECDS